MCSTLSGTHVPLDGLWLTQHPLKSIHEYLGSRDSGSVQSNMRNGRDAGEASREGGRGQHEASLDDQWEGMVEQKEMAVQDAHEITVDLFIALLEADPRTSIDQVR